MSLSISSSLIISVASLFLATLPADPLPVYPGALRYPIHGELVYGGVPMRLFAQDTSASVPEIVAFYRSAFERAGLAVMPAAPGMPLGITGVDADAERVYVAMIMTHEEGGCTIFSGYTEMGRRRRPGEEMYGMPLVPGAKEIMGTKVGETTGGVVTFVAPRAASDVSSFYREELAKRGFVFRASDDQGDLIFQREKAASWKVSIKQPDPKVAQSVVILTELGGAK